MDEMYGTQAEGDDYSDKALMTPDNLMIPPEYHDHYHYSHSFNVDDDHQHRNSIPAVFGSGELGFQCSVMSNESASFDVGNQREAADEDHDQGMDYTGIKAKIASHPSYPKLLDAYIDCQKVVVMLRGHKPQLCVCTEVGAPPEIVLLLDEMRLEKDLSKQEAVPMCLGVEPELDEFMETYCEILLKCKSDLSRPLDEATSFLSKIETQLGNLCNVDGALSSDEELSRSGEIEIQDSQMKSEDRQLKERLLRRYGDHISSLKLEFTKKKKKGKLPKEARQTLFQWWNLHCKWPYPTEADKIALAEATGLDQKQINNWFINQRKRHWKSPENMDNLSAHFLPEDSSSPPQYS